MHATRVTLVTVLPVLTLTSVLRRLVMPMHHAQICQVVYLRLFLNFICLSYLRNFFYQYLLFLLFIYPPGSFVCTCNPGYVGSGLECSDLDECVSSPCDSNATCSNNDGAFTCTCLLGYTGDGFTCTDIDECVSSPCSAYATCTNEPGDYNCACDSGFTGDGHTCSDIDECLSSPCNVHASCSNTPGFLFTV